MPDQQVHSIIGQVLRSMDMGVNIVLLDSPHNDPMDLVARPFEPGSIAAIAAKDRLLLAVSGKLEDQISFNNPKPLLGSLIFLAECPRLAATLNPAITRRLVERLKKSSREEQKAAATALAEIARKLHPSETRAAFEEGSVALTAAPTTAPHIIVAAANAATLTRATRAFWKSVEGEVFVVPGPFPDSPATTNKANAAYGVYVRKFALEEGGMYVTEPYDGDIDPVAYAAFRIERDLENAGFRLEISAPHPPEKSDTAFIIQVSAPA